MSQRPILGLALVLCLTASLPVVAEPSVGDPYRILSRDDYHIYSSILERCVGRGAAGVVSVAFDPSLVVSGALNWLQVLQLDSTAQVGRWKNRGLSPAVARLRSSEGYWLALTHCYGYRYGMLNRGWLAKQLMDLGHLLSETTALSAGILSVFGAGKIIFQVNATYPLATRLVASAAISLAVADALVELKGIWYPHISEEDRAHYQHIESLIFSEPEEALSEVRTLAEGQVARLKTILKDPQITEEEHQRYSEKLKRLDQLLRDMSDSEGS